MTFNAKNDLYQKIIFTESFDKNDSNKINKVNLSAYEEAGVNIHESDLLMDAVKSSIKMTHTPNVIGNMGSFGGLFSMQEISSPDLVLVSSCDGVGTKAKLAQAFDRLNVIGYDIVNHCVNDILCMGASPLFMLDYLGVNKLDHIQHQKVIKGFAEAAKMHGIPVIGGETAEMPRIYRDRGLELIGIIIGAVERNKILPSKEICDTDILIGFPSSGPHTNGYTLIYKLSEDGSLGLNDETLDEILTPHRTYYQMLKPLVNCNWIKGLAHITGGGFDNILRIIPNGLSVKIKNDSWKIPDIFFKIQQAGKISNEEMFKVYNMGIGMVAVVDPIVLHWIIKEIGLENFYIIGTLEESKEKVLNFV